MSSQLPRPAIVVAADWSASERGRWMVRAIADGDGYRIEAPTPVGDPSTLVDRLREAAGESGAALLGIDFPIGIPRHYALQAGIPEFLHALPRLGRGEWRRFFQVTDSPSLRQPFAPASNEKGGLTRNQLAQALGLSSADELLRACDHATPTRGAAESLFFTRFAKQVGRAAIHGWRELLQPAVDRALFWPFDGDLPELLGQCRVVVAEIYPAEAASHLGITIGPGTGRSKRRVADRREALKTLSDVVSASGSRFSPEAQSAVETGLPNDDAFDALIGLVSMIEVVEGRRPHHAPFDPGWQRIEGWILGQAPEMPEGRPWLNRDAQRDSAAAERKLVVRLRAGAADLRELLDSCSDMWGYEDPVYRFYHQSFKVYAVQQKTLQMVRALRDLGVKRELDHRFEQIVREGTQKRFESEHNLRWTEVTRPILEAFFHARFFLEMAVRYSDLQAPPRPLPSGYAALLYLYGLLGT